MITSLIGLWGTSLFSQSFKLQDTFTLKNFNYYFSSLNINEINRIDSQQLHPDIRPFYWPKSIPFGVGLNIKKKQAFYIHFLPFFFSNIIKINHPDFQDLTDICTTRDGLIYITDKTQHKIFCFQVNLTKQTVSFIKTIPIQTPLRCETDQKGNLYVLSKTKGLVIFNPTTSSYKKQNAISKTILANSLVDPLEDLTISTHHIIILTRHRLYKFTPVGTLIKTKILPAPCKSLDHTFYEDIITLHYSKNKLFKFNSSLDIIDEVDISNTLPTLAQDISIYKPFGYVGINALQTGVYYACQADIQNLRISKHNKFPTSHYYQIQFNLPFISTVSVDIKDSQNKLVKSIFSDKILKSKSYTIFWNGRDTNNTPCEGTYTIFVKAKGLYSITKTISVSQSFLLKNRTITLL